MAMAMPQCTAPLGSPGGARWIQDAMTTEPRPWIKVVCVITQGNRLRILLPLPGTNTPGALSHRGS